MFGSELLEAVGCRQGLEVEVAQAEVLVLEARAAEAVGRPVSTLVLTEAAAVAAAVTKSRALALLRFFGLRPPETATAESAV